MTPGTRRRVLPTGLRWAIVWTCTLPLAAILVTTALWTTVVPYAITAKVHRFVFCQSKALNTTLEVTGHERIQRPAILGGAGGKPPNEVEIRDALNGLRMTANLATGAYEYRKANGSPVKGASGISGAVLADWLATGGVNAASPGVRETCDAAWGAIAEIGRGSANGFTPLKDATGAQIGIAHPAMLWTVRDEPHPAVAIGTIALWLGVWVWGLLWIYRRKRRTASLHRF